MLEPVLPLKTFLEGVCEALERLIQQNITLRNPLTYAGHDFSQKSQACLADLKAFLGQGIAPLLSANSVVVVLLKYMPRTLHWHYDRKRKCFFYQGSQINNELLAFIAQSCQYCFIYMEDSEKADFAHQISVMALRKEHYRNYLRVTANGVKQPSELPRYLDSDVPDINEGDYGAAMCQFYKVAKGMSMQLRLYPYVEESSQYDGDANFLRITKSLMDSMAAERVSGTDILGAGKKKSLQEYQQGCGILEAVKLLDVSAKVQQENRRQAFTLIISSILRSAAGAPAPMQSVIVAATSVFLTARCHGVSVPSRRALPALPGPSGAVSASLGVFRRIRRGAAQKKGGAHGPEQIQETLPLQRILESNAGQAPPKKPPRQKRADRVCLNAQLVIEQPPQRVGVTLTGGEKASKKDAQGAITSSTHGFRFIDEKRLHAGLERVATDRRGEAGSSRRQWGVTEVEARDILKAMAGTDLRPNSVQGPEPSDMPGYLGVML